jgi:DNA adenine methylase
MSLAGIELPTQECPPFLRWAGSKRRLLPILQAFWMKKHKRYVEPFAGSACLFFAIKPVKAILGDLNPEPYQRIGDRTCDGTLVCAGSA